MVRRSSVLGCAIAKLRSDFGPLRIQGFEEVLLILEMDSFAEAAWDTLVKATKPASDSRLALQVLIDVAFSYLEVPRALRSVGRQAEIEARFAEAAAALDVLQAIFTGPIVVRSYGAEHDDTARPLPANGSEFHPELPEALRLVLEVRRAQPKGAGEPEPCFSDPRAQAYHEQLKIERTAKAALRDMRSYLEMIQDASMAVEELHLTSRKRADPNARRRAFTFALDRRLRDVLGSPRSEFVITVAEVLFPSSSDNLLTLEATRAVSVREAERRAKRATKGGV